MTDVRCREKGAALSLALGERRAGSLQACAVPDDDGVNGVAAQAAHQGPVPGGPSSRSQRVDAGGEHSNRIGQRWLGSWPSVHSPFRSRV
jgi:hypothetical protein